MVPCILALDDEAAILTIVRSTLEQRGFRVVTAKSLAQFRKVDAQEQVDLYLIDTSLPDGNGLSLLRELRKVSDRGIILLAPQRDEAEGVLGLELGADDTLLKPFRERELAARVGAVFRRTGRPVASLPAGRPGIDTSSTATASAFRRASSGRRTGGRSSSPPPSSNCWPRCSGGGGRFSAATRS